MRIGKRIFPYPVLNSKSELSDFRASVFELNFDVNNDDKLLIENNHFVLKNICFKLHDFMFEKLYDEGLIDCLCIVECPASVYREKFKLKREPMDLQIETENFIDEVQISAYLYATQTINQYKCESFDEIYENIVFSLERFEILAVDDGYSFNVDIDEDKEKKVESIFTIIRKSDDSELLNYEAKNRKIFIYLPNNQYSYYEQLKHNSRFHNILFSILVIPVLAQAISNLQEYTELSSIEDLFEGNTWFSSVVKRYKEVENIPLEYDAFLEMNSLELAQKVLNYASLRSLDNFKELEESAYREGEYDE